MSKMFIDNIGKVFIHDKGEYLPGTLRVRMSSSHSSLSPLNGVISIFVASVKNARTSQFGLKQNLLSEYTIIPFGEAPGQLSVQGVVFTTGQVNLKDNAGAAYDRLLEGTPFEETPAKIEPEEKTGEWADALNATKKYLDGAVSDVKDSAAVATLSSAVQKANSAIIGIKSIVSAVVGFPGAVAGAIKSALGLSGEESLAVLPLTGDDLTPLSYAQLQRVFDLIQIGVMGEVGVNRPEVTIAYGGVVFVGHLVALSTTSMPGNVGFSFELSFLCLKPPTYIRADVPPTVKTRGENSAFNQVAGALTEYGLSAVRTRQSGVV